LQPERLHVLFDLLDQCRLMFRVIEAGVSPGMLGIREASSRM
jgi:hypothetical protein